MTRAQVEALRIQREDLGSQLTNVLERRNALADRLLTADRAARPGLEQQLEVLNLRVVALEQALAETGLQLGSAEAGLAQVAPPGLPPLQRLDPDQITGISIVFILLVLFPMAIAATRLMWKRATTPRVKPNSVDSERLERVEQAVETIAIEIERISEGQRFVTKLLAPPHGVPVGGSGQREDESARAARISPMGSREGR